MNALEIIKGFAIGAGATLAIMVFVWLCVWGTAAMMDKIMRGPWDV